MTKTLEPTLLDDFLRDEDEIYRSSRSAETLLLGQNLLIGTVVAKVLLSVPTIGTLSTGTKGECVSVTGNVSTQLGTYTATCTTANEAAVDGVWRIEAPDGAVLGDLVVTAGESGTGAFTDPQINLTINYETNYNDLADVFGIEVVDGSLSLVAVDFDATVDGTQTAQGVLIKDYDATDAAIDCVAIIREAVLAKSHLVWRLEFTSGGTTIPAIGDYLYGVTTTTSYCRIMKINLTSGAWADGDAAGTLLVDHFSADFVAENVYILNSDPTSSEFFTTATDRTFTGGTTHWASTDFGTTFDETTDLTIVADATGQYGGITFTNLGTNLVSGTRYRLKYDYSELVAGFEFKLAGASTQTLGDAVPGTNQYIDFVADEAYATTDALNIYSKTNALASGSFDNFSIKEFDDLTVAATDITGAFVELEANGIITREEA